MVQYLSRAEFLEGYWDYRRGEHVALIEPTGGGKSYLLRQLLHYSQAQNPALRVVYLMPKPNSPTTYETARNLGYKITPSWPPAPRWPWQEKPNGYVIWPPHSRGDVQVNRDQLAARFRPALAAQYWDGNSITVADDLHVLARLALMPDFEEHWTAGREAGAGLWTANQKPSGTTGVPISTYNYSAPTHLFLGRDRTDANTKRFSEIGGVDPWEIRRIVRDLRITRIGDAAVSEKLYIDRRGPYMAVVGL